GNDLMPGRVVFVVVDAENDGDVRAFRGGGDHHLLRAGCDVLGRVVAFGEQSGRLEDNVDAEVFPRQLRRVAHRQHLELVAVDRDRFSPGLDLRVQITEHRVVLQQVRKRVRIREIVDGDNVDVRIAECRPHDVPADAAEPVNANPHRHRYILQTNVSFYNSSSDVSRVQPAYARRV